MATRANTVKRTMVKLRGVWKELAAITLLLCITGFCARVICWRADVERTQQDIRQAYAGLRAALLSEDYAKAERYFVPGWDKAPRAKFENVWVPYMLSAPLRAEFESGGLYVSSAPLNEVGVRMQTSTEAWIFPSYAGMFEFLGTGYLVRKVGNRWLYTGAVVEYSD